MEKTLEYYSSGSHADYRLFMSAEPAATAAAHIIPQVRIYPYHIIHKLSKKYNKFVE